MLKIAFRLHRYWAATSIGEGRSGSAGCWPTAALPWLTERDPAYAVRAMAFRAGVLDDLHRGAEAADQMRDALAERCGRDSTAQQLALNLPSAARVCSDLHAVPEAKTHLEKAWPMLTAALLGEGRVAEAAEAAADALQQARDLGMSYPGRGRPRGADHSGGPHPRLLGSAGRVRPAQA